MGQSSTRVHLYASRELQFCLIMYIKVLEYFHSCPSRTKLLSHWSIPIELSSGQYV